MRGLFDQVLIELSKMDDRPPIDIEANPDRASDSDSSDEAPRPLTLRETQEGSP